MSSTKQYELSKLDKISTLNGDVFHGLKRTDKSYVGFGEAYFSFISYKKKKGWKKHKKMTLNLLVPVGSIKFYIFDDTQSILSTVEIGRENYRRLTIPPGQWVAFEGLGEQENIILNIADIEHEAIEAEAINIENFKVKI